MGLTKISTDHEVYVYANGNGIVTVLVKCINDAQNSGSLNIGRIPKGYCPPTTLLQPCTESSFVQIGTDGIIYFRFSKTQGAAPSVSNIVCTITYLATQ